MSPLLTSKILGLYVNTLIADDNYSLRNSENLQQQLQMHLFKKQKFSLTSLRHFWNLNQILNILKKQMSLLADVFRKLELFS